MSKRQYNQGNTAPRTKQTHSQSTPGKRLHFVHNFLFCSSIPQPNGVTTYNQPHTLNLHDITHNGQLKMKVKSQEQGKHKTHQHRQNKLTRGQVEVVEKLQESLITVKQ